MMVPYVSAVCAGVTFAFTGQPSGLRLLCALAVTNLALYVFGRVQGDLRDEVDA